MPGRDGTGPEGEGPGTGRGLGPCTTTEGQLDDQREQGLEKVRKAPRAPKAPKDGGKGRSGGRRRGPKGITYFT